jgi:hypothetical protein
LGGLSSLQFPSPEKRHLLSRNDVLSIYQSSCSKTTSTAKSSRAYKMADSFKFPRVFSAQYRDSRIPSPEQEPSTFKLSLNCYSTSFNPPYRFYHRAAIAYTMHSTTSIRANTYLRALVALFTNGRVNRLLTTVSPTHGTRCKSTIS